MSCQRCESRRVASISAKCSDLFSITFPGGKEQQGYVPGMLGIGHGDYVEFEYCFDCGQIQGVFPVLPTKEQKKQLKEEGLLDE